MEVAPGDQIRKFRTSGTGNGSSKNGFIVNETAKELSRGENGVGKVGNKMNDKCKRVTEPPCVGD